MLARRRSDVVNVVSLPGVFRSDLVEPTNPQDVLAAAMDLPLKDVVVVGRNVNGNIEVFASQTDADATIGLLTRGLSYLASSEQVDEPEPPA